MRLHLQPLANDVASLTFAVLLGAFAGSGSSAPVVAAAVAALASALLLSREPTGFADGVKQRLTRRLEATAAAGVAIWALSLPSAGAVLSAGLWLAAGAVPSLPLIRKRAPWLGRCIDFSTTTATRLFHALPTPVMDGLAGLVVLVPVLILASRFWPGTETPPIAFWLYAAALVALPSALAHRFTAGTAQRRLESLRYAALMALAFWLFQPIAYPVIHGSGDANWYATMLADALSQARAGVLPLFGGQSLHQFNGALYPLRIAPGFHYLGVLFDVLTGRSLDAVSVQNFMIVSWAMAAAVSAYSCASRFLRAHPGIAWLLALAFVCCPGVMAVAYFTDLYMSWTTIPLLPVVFTASLLLYEQVTLRRCLTLGGALGMLWWGHTPIALWVTVFATVLQLHRLWVGRRQLRHDFRNLSAAALAFAFCAAFPVISATRFPPETGAPTTSFQKAEPNNIARFLAEASPGNLLPLHDGGRSLSAFQLGYTFWAALVLLLVVLVRIRDRRLLVPALLALFLALWLNPLPGLAIPQWSLIPALIRDTTGNWVMNRLYAIFAALLLPALAIALGHLLTSENRCLYSGLRLTLIALLLWSVSEALKFGRESDKIRGASPTPEAVLAPENTVITRFAYLGFGGTPPNFSDGVVDPELEHTLIDARGKRHSLESLILEAAAQNDPRTRTTPLAPFANLGEERRWSIAQPLRLEPEKRYLLVFDFSQSPALNGVLQLQGSGLLRQYQLPRYGGPASFGSAPGAKHTLPLRTSRATGDSVHIRYVFAQGETPATLRAVRVSVIEYAPDVVPLRIHSWIPYEASLALAEPCLVETPRMYQSWWRHTTGGVLERTGDGLLAFRHPGGSQTHRIEYAVPLLFRVLFFAGLACFAAASAIQLVPAFNRKRHRAG
ncbi:hypothetical protein [Nibricoccus sp. IMCC34717]|uniref:hypothetical protein n=1 Tax=Nibricoccus sp. IMCC34717 TaxID=3034021 RepID=UPI0038516513